MIIAVKLDVRSCPHCPSFGGPVKRAELIHSSKRIQPLTHIFACLQCLSLYLSPSMLQFSFFVHGSEYSFLP